jgi:hypothetical protein
MALSENCRKAICALFELPQHESFGQPGRADRYQSRFRFLPSRVGVIPKECCNLLRGRPAWARDI